jgi:transposase
LERLLHFLRLIDRVVELDGLRQKLAPFHSAIGRRSVDPELMIRMLIVGRFRVPNAPGSFGACMRMRTPVA